MDRSPESQVDASVAGDGNSAGLSFWVALTASVGLVIGLILLLPMLLLGIAFWSADGEWAVEGPGIRYWLLVKGSRLERLGTVGEVTGPVRYSVRFADGTFPGWSVASYATTAMPAAIVETYAQRCRDSALRITAQTSVADAERARATLVCEIEPYIDVEVGAERATAVPATRVNVKVWGGS